MLGARWVHREILAKDPTHVLSVYVVWFNMYPGDKRSRWNPKRISDPRVIHYWDKDKIAGKWLVERRIVEYPDKILWDAFLLFDRKALWLETPQPLSSWGRPVYPERNKLASSLKELSD